MKSLPNVLLMAVLFITLTGASEEGGRDLAWGKYSSSQKKIQVAFHHLVRLNWPDLKDIIHKSQELQLALVDERDRRFYYLLEHEPDRIVRDDGFSAFVNFDWAEEDTDSLREKNPNYRKLEKKIKKLKKEVDEDGRYKQVQDNLKSLEGERPYMAIMARFRFVAEEVERILEIQSGRSSA